MRPRSLPLGRPVRPGKSSGERWSSGTLCGVNAIREALLTGGRTLETIWVAEGRGGKRIRDILALAAQRGIPVTVVPGQHLTEAAGTAAHQGLLASVVPTPRLALDDLLPQILAQTPVPPIVILDGIKDPRNLGAILRSAAAFGIGGVILSLYRACDITATVAKAAAGGLEHVPVAHVANISQSIERVKQAGYWVVGADEKAAASCTSYAFPHPLGLVFGEEATGISPLVKRHCDTLLRIPLAGRLQSLNVAVAAAVLFYEVERQRGSVGRFR